MAKQLTSLKLTVKATEYCYNSRYQFLSPALTSKVMLKISVMTESYVIHLCKAENQKAESQKAKFKRQKIKWQKNQKAKNQ